MKKHWAIVLPLLVMGCNTPDNSNQQPTPVDPTPQGPDTVVYVPATPKGTVSGQVLNTRMTPLADATVKLTLGSATADKPFTAKTDAEGNFLFTGVPAGSQVLVTASKDGYATLRATATVPASAGNVPIDNGNANVGAVLLAETQSTVRFTLVTPSGQPAVGAQAYLEALPAGRLAYGGGAALASSSVVAAPTKADASGVVTFTQVPGAAELARIGAASGDDQGGYRLWVDPVDLNGDGVPDLAGSSAKYNASDLLTTPSKARVTLSSAVPDTSATAFNLAATPALPSLLYTSLDAADPARPTMELTRRPVRNFLRLGEPLYLSFSHPVVRDSFLAIVTDEFGRESYPFSAVANATGDGYTLTPPAGVLKEGQEYNITLRATSAYSGAAKTWKGYGVGGDPRTPRALAVTAVTFRDGTSGTAGMLDPGECVYVYFNQLVTPSTLQIDVSLAGADGSAIGFRAAPVAPPSTGTSCIPAETVKYPVDSTFNLATTRFAFAYGPAGSSNPVLNPATARAKVDFARFQAVDPTMYYETAWGSPVPSSTVFEVPLTKP